MADNETTEAPEAATPDPVEDQGAQAKELGLTAADCPYVAQGDNRAKWFAGLGEADPEAPSAE